MLDTRVYPPEFRGNYPHMFPGDVAVWERFLDSYGSIYTGFQYDIMCGVECEQFPRWEENYRRDAAVLSRLRIDAVGYRSDGIDIIEVKPRAGAAAIGQILTYRDLFIQDYKPSQSVRGVIVTGIVDENVKAIADKQGIAFIAV